VIIDKLDIESIVTLPPEAKAPPLVNADAVLARTVASVCREQIRWRNHKIAQIHGAVEVHQPRACALLNRVVRALHELALDYRSATVFLKV
jgi:hypothetical protein